MNIIYIYIISEKGDEDMKYRRRRKSDTNYESIPQTSGRKKGKTAKKIVFGMAFLPLILSVTANTLAYKKHHISSSIDFLKAVWKDAAMYVSEKIPRIDEVGKMGAKFCFEYIRGDKKESMPVISTLDSKTSPIMSITEEADKAIEVKADSETSPEPIPADVFSPIMPCEGNISSPFGKRIHPLSGQESSHNGIDIAIDSGTDVCAIESGTILKSEYNQFSGNFIVISHQDGYTSSYAHLEESNVKSGDIVKKGDIIGKSGSTGAVTGPHLHMEIRKDSTPVDPMTLIKVN